MAELIKYVNTNFSGECVIDDGFVPVADQINDVCKKHGFIFIVTNSRRKPTDQLKGAIVEPSKMSNHFVGHALDGNLKNIATGEYYNSVKMGDGKGADECVIRAIEALGIRWGGEFRKKDEVHFDDALNLKNPAHWNILNTKFNS